MWFHGTMLFSTRCNVKVCVMVGVMVSVMVGMVVNVMASVRFFSAARFDVAL